MKRRLLLSGLLVSSMLLPLVLPGSALGDDWAVRRAAFDQREVARYKALLGKRPNDGYALRKLVALYRKHRTLAALVAEYRAQAKANPTSHAYQVVLGHLYRRTGDTTQAIHHYERAAKLSPKNPAVPAALAALYQKLGRTEEATAAYKKALSLARTPREKKRHLRSLANLALGTGDTATARRYFDQLVALEPRNVLVRMELAQALAKSGHEAEAIVQYRSILGQTSDSATKADVLKEIGALLHKQGKDAEAVATYRKAMTLAAKGHWLRRELTERIIAIYREKEDLRSLIDHYERTWKRRGQFEHEVLGRLYDMTGDETKALEAYRSALKAAPHAVDTRQRLILLLQRAGKDKEVIEEYRKLVRIAPGEPRFQLELAKLLYRSGNQKEAFTVLQRCGGRFPGDASVHSALADLYARWGEQRRAMQAAQVLVRIEPNDPSHLVNLGEQHFLQGNKRKAVEVWRKLLSVIPKRHEALAKLAEIYGQHEMTREAIDLFRKAIKLKPKHLPYHRGLALLLERKRHTTKALQAWGEVLKLARASDLASGKREARTHIIDILHRSYHLRSQIRFYRREFEDPSHPDLDAGYMLAEAHVKLGQLAQAAGVYQRILELDPKSLEAMTALEGLYRRQRRLAEAVALLKRMATVNPQSAREYYQKIAELLLQLYNDEEALVYAHKAVELGTGDARSYERLGELYEKKEDYARAMKAYAKAIKLAPSRFRVHFALARLRTQQGSYEEAEKVYRQVLRGATTPEVIRKAFRLCVELSAYLGQLKQLEREVLSLSVMSPNAEVYRQLLVQIYRRRIPMLVDRARQGTTAAARAAARTELHRIGVRGLAPLLEELATTNTGVVELIRMLGYLGNANAVIPLLRIAEQEPEEEVITIRGSSSPYYSSGYYSSPRSRLSQRANRRVEATVAVGRIASERGTDGLVRLLGNREGPIRDAAAWGLGRLGGGARVNRRAAKALFAALGDQRGTVQMMACAGLGMVGGPEMGPVLEEVMLDTQRPERVRAACAWGLGTLGSKAASGSLAGVLQSGDESLERCAAWSLGVQGDPKPLSALVRALWSKRQSVRAVVVWAIARIASGSKVELPAQLPDVVVKQGRLDAEAFLDGLTGEVEELRGKDLARSLAALVDTHRDALKVGLKGALSRHRDVVLRVLGDLDAEPGRLSLGPLTAGRDLLEPAEQARLDGATRAVCAAVRPRLAELLGHRDALIRERAVSVYAKLSAGDIETRLRGSLRDARWQVRVRALQSLAVAHQRGLVKREAVLELLSGGLRAHHWRQREAAAVLLGQLGDPAASEALVRALADANGFVREAAVRALGRSGGPGATDALRRALRDEVPHVRAAACASLGRLRALQARGDLGRLARDPSPLVRRAASAALRRLR